MWRSGHGSAGQHNELLVVHAYLRGYFHSQLIIVNTQTAQYYQSIQRSFQYFFFPEGYDFTSYVGTSLYHAQGYKPRIVYMCSAMQWPS